MLSLWRRLCASSALPAWINVKRKKKNPTSPSHVAPCQGIHLAPHDRLKSCINPGGDGGRVGGGRRVPPPKRPLSLLKPANGGGRTGCFGGVGVCQPGPQGRLCLHAPSGQNKCWGLHPSAWTNKQIKEGERDTTRWSRREGGRGGRKRNVGEHLILIQFWYQYVWTAAAKSLFGRWLTYCNVAVHHARK